MRCERKSDFTFVRKMNKIRESIAESSISRENSRYANEDDPEDRIAQRKGWAAWLNVKWRIFHT